MRVGLIRKLCQLAVGKTCWGTESRILRHSSSERDGSTHNEHNEDLPSSYLPCPKWRARMLRRMKTGPPITPPLTAPSKPNRGRHNQPTSHCTGRRRPTTASPTTNTVAEAVLAAPARLGQLLSGCVALLLLAATAQPIRNKHTNGSFCSTTS